MSKIERVNNDSGDSDISVANSMEICVKKLANFSGDIKRLNDLKQFFISEFNEEPEFFVKVPGRVNIIGEHVDYCGYPVLPMAIAQNILLAVRKTTNNDERLYLKNINGKYGDYEVDIKTFKIELPEIGGPAWFLYFLCGVKGISEAIFANDKNAKLLNGMKVAVSGNIPPASGLSSSSALVSAAALATSYLNDFSLNKHFLSNISASCERYIGTQGGGMDQAIAFLAQEGCAQFIEWEPLRASPVNLPSNIVFVIANSLAEANKAATSDFNQRVIECRLACNIIAKHCNLNSNEILSSQKIDRFGTLQNILNISSDDMEKLAKKYLTKKLYTREDIINELNINMDEFVDKFLTPNTKHLMEFKLRQRALHVLQETIRVGQFRKIANNNGSSVELGELMRQSHASLQIQYECSHEKLNELVHISDLMNIDARLTGAGWGGCIVALCNSVEESQLYINELKEKYYKTMINNEINLDSVVFATSPQNGAEIYLNNN